MKYLLILLLVVSCSTTKYSTQKAYICYEVFPTSNGEIVHKFANLSLTIGRDIYLKDTVCKPFDTVIIKDYYQILKKRTYITNK